MKSLRHFLFVMAIFFAVIPACKQQDSKEDGLLGFWFNAKEQTLLYFISNTVCLCATGVPSLNEPDLPWIPMFCWVGAYDIENSITFGENLYRGPEGMPNYSIVSVNGKTLLYDYCYDMVDEDLEGEARERAIQRRLKTEPYFSRVTYRPKAEKGKYDRFAKQETIAPFVIHFTDKGLDEYCKEWLDDYQDAGGRYCYSIGEGGTLRYGTAKESDEETFSLTGREMKVYSTQPNMFLRELSSSYYEDYDGIIIPKTVTEVNLRRFYKDDSLKWVKVPKKLLATFNSATEDRYKDIVTSY